MAAKTAFLIKAIGDASFSLLRSTDDRSFASIGARQRQGWKTFLRNHAEGVASIDLFVVPTISFRLLYGFLILEGQPSTTASLACSRPRAVPPLRRFRRSPGQPHSVRGFFAAVVKKKLGLALESEKTRSGRIYRIVRAKTSTSTPSPSASGTAEQGDA
jgi:hypothetical protein